MTCNKYVILLLTIFYGCSEPSTEQYTSMPIQQQRKETKSPVLVEEEPYDSLKYDSIVTYHEDGTKSTIYTEAGCEYWTRKGQWITDMQIYILDNQRYPEDAIKNNITGAVLVNAQFKEDTTVYVNIINGLGYGCDEEAIRVYNAYWRENYDPNRVGTRMVHSVMFYPSDTTLMN